MKSSSPAVRPVEVLEDQDHRSRARRCARRRSATRQTAPRARAGASPRGRAGCEARLDPSAFARPLRARTRRGWPRALARVAASSVSAMPARSRTISASAQKPMPSPYDGERPGASRRWSTPSMYFWNSHASRLLPMPAWPTTETSAACSRGRWRGAVLEQAQLLVTADERRLEPLAATPPRSRRPGARATRPPARPCP